MWNPLQTWRRLRNLTHRRAMERDLQDEMRLHLEQRQRDLVDGGLSEEEAARAARLSFGNVTAIGEQSREVWSFTRLETWLQDAAYCVRVLVRRDRVWALAAIATLAIGIGGTVSTFSMVNAFLLRPLPFAEPDRLVHLWTADTRLKTAQGRFSIPDFLELRDEARSFEGLAAFNYTEEDLSGAAHRP
jgi:hypothetical protein